MRSRWSDLHPDYLMTVAERLKGNLCDLVRMGAVCKNWRAFFIEQNWMGSGPRMHVLRGVTSYLHHPKLMLPAAWDDGENGEFLDWKTEGRILIQQPQLHGMRICGSGYGWLVTEGANAELDGGYSLQLLNPITQEQKLLPIDLVFQPFPILEDMIPNITKAIVVGNPSETRNCTIIAFNEMDLFWLTGPDDAQGWTTRMAGADLGDIEHHNGLLYALLAPNNFGRLEVWDLGTAQRLRVLEAFVPDYRYFESPYPTHFTFQCLQVSGVLMGVITLSPSKLVVFELNEGSVEDKEPPKWVPVTDLGDCCLFLGENSSMALSPVPPTSGFRSNSVYFARYEFWNDLYSLHRYDMRDGSSEEILLHHTYVRSSITWLTFNPDMAAW